MMAALGLENPDDAVGRGGGLTDESFARKKRVIGEALFQAAQRPLAAEEAAARRQAHIDSGTEEIVGVNSYRLDKEDPLEILEVEDDRTRLLSLLILLHCPFLPNVPLLRR